MTDSKEQPILGIYFWNKAIRIYSRSLDNIKGVQLYLFLCINKNLSIESQKAENSPITSFVDKGQVLFYCFISFKHYKKKLSNFKKKSSL